MRESPLLVPTVELVAPTRTKNVSGAIVRMEPEPILVRIWRSAEIRFTITGVVGLVMSESPRSSVHGLAFEIHVQAIEPVLPDDGRHRVHELLPFGRVAKLHMAIGAADGKQNLLAAAVEDLHID